MGWLEEISERAAELKRAAARKAADSREAARLRSVARLERVAGLKRAAVRRAAELKKAAARRAAELKKVAQSRAAEAARRTAVALDRAAESRKDARVKAAKAAEAARVKAAKAAEAAREKAVAKKETRVTRVTVTVRTIPYANIHYGNAKYGVFETKTDRSGAAQFNWPLLYGRLYVNAQKYNYVFSNFKFISIMELPTPRPAVGEPPSPVIREPNWGASSRWFPVSLVKRSVTLFALPRGAEPKEIIKGVKGIICDAWDTAAKIDAPVELSTRLPISISNAMWICKEDPSITELLTGVSAIAYIEGCSFDIPITNGRGWVNLGTKPEISELIASLVPPLPSSIPLEISIPNKTSGFTSWSYSLKPPVVPVDAFPRVGIPEVWIPKIKIPIEIPIGIPVEVPVKVPVKVPVVVPTISKTLVIRELPSSVFKGDVRTVVGMVDVDGSPVTGEPVVMKVDGEVVGETVTSNGVFAFEHTFNKAGSRKFVFESPATDKYPDYGRAVGRVSVSSVPLEHEERLRAEREEYAARREALKRERIIVPKEYKYKPIFRREKQVTPEREIEPEIPPDEQMPPIPTRGSIQVDLPVPPIPGQLIEVPVAVWLDDVFRGNAPTTIDNVKVGSHTVVLKMTGFVSPSIDVEVREGEVTRVSGIKMIIR